MFKLKSEHKFYMRLLVFLAEVIFIICWFTRFWNTSMAYSSFDWLSFAMGCGHCLKAAVATEPMMRELFNCVDEFDELQNELKRLAHLD